MVEAVLENIAMVGDESERHFLVLLKAQRGRAELLPIVIDPLQAMSIVAGRSHESLGRPLTHDLMLSVLEVLNATIKRIEITDMRSNDDGSGTYYARLILENRGVEFDIDARPSDALALAVRTEAPIYIAEEVLDEHAQAGPEGSGSVQA